jgi:hypothetical protein
MPATNAPSASDRPARSVIQAAPSVTSSRFSMNSSCERRLATMVNHLRISFWPKNSSSASTPAAFTAAQPRFIASSSAGRASEGIRISSGTTARSWNSRIPMMRRPCSLSSSRRSVSILETIAVDDIASAPPSASAACQPTLSGAGRRGLRKATSIVTRMVSATWASPSPNTMRRIALSWASENSRPIENIRNTTPNSASAWVLGPLSASCRACGPISTPTAR